VRVVVKPYSGFKDKLGGDVILEFSENEIRVKNILEKLEYLYSISRTGVKPIIIIGYEIVDENYALKSDYVEIYLVPPFSGG